MHVLGSIKESIHACCRKQWKKLRLRRRMHHSRAAIHCFTFCILHRLYTQQCLPLASRYRPSMPFAVAQDAWTQLGSVFAPPSIYIYRDSNWCLLFFFSRIPINDCKISTSYFTFVSSSASLNSRGHSSASNAFCTAFVWNTSSSCDICVIRFVMSV